MSAVVDSPVRQPSIFVRYEKEILWLFILLAGARVFFYSSGFPFFTNIDELFQFDVVLRYSVGDIPRKGVDVPTERAARLAVLYASQEFLYPADRGPFPLPPLWTQPGIENQPQFQKLVDERFGLSNHEVATPPVYYVLAASWFRLGELLGVTGLSLLYWVRLLNVPAAMTLVWLAFQFSKRWFGAHEALPLAVAVLVAAMPQDVYYSVNPDVLSALIYTAALHFALVSATSSGTMRSAIMAGLAMSCAMLVKFANITILAPMSILSFNLLRLRRDSAGIPRRLSRLVAIWFTPAIVVGAWFAWNKWTIGDWTATADKIRVLDWTVKPMDEMLDHPLFTVNGASFFLARLTEKFWQGEIMWRGAWLHARWLDALDVATTAVFLAISIFAIAFRRRASSPSPNGQRDEPWLVMLLTVLSAVVWMAFLSVRFDFGKCFNPSRAEPYFVSGRLIFGVVVPFAILYVHGLGVLLSALRLRFSPVAVVILLAAIVSVGELQLTVPVFSSQFNWYRIWP